MGRPMALNLVKGGHALRVNARRAESMAPLTQAGAIACSSPAEAASGSDVIFTMVSDTPVVEQVLLGPGGVVEGAAPGTAVVDMSTISPVATRALADKLAAKGVEMLDAPVSGGERGAIAGTLSIMVGGSAQVFERMKPVLDCIGKTVVYIGAAGAGEVAKAVNQLVLVVSIQAIAEAMTFARANGVDFRPIWEALMQGFAGSRMLDIIGQRMLNREFVMGLDASLHHKNAHIVLQCARESCTCTPAAALAAQAFNALFARPGVKWDSAAILKVVEELSGFPQRSARP